MSLPSYRTGAQASYPSAPFSQQPQQQRHPSGQPNPQSPPFARPTAATFPFGAASSALPPATPNHSIGTAAEPNLDPSDFPALGSVAAAAAAPGASSATSAAASSLLSSYASQAGIASSSLPFAQSPGASLTNGTSLSGLSASAAGATSRELSADDFPALNGLGGSDMASNPNSLVNGQLNGLGGAARLSAKDGQEQASAAAALQHQQQQSQHRANLLGSMNAAAGHNRATSGHSLSESDKRNHGLKQSGNATGQQPWAATPPGQFSLNGANSASSPLPPSSSSQVTEQPNTLWSPSTNSAQMPLSGLGQSHLQQRQPHQQRPVGALGASNSPLPPPASSTQPGNSSATSGTGQIPQTPAQQVLFSPADRYGLLGLLQIIKTADPDVNMLALGTDLTTLGLDLGATENLYSTFITPWSDSKAAAALNIEPEFHLPSCYNVQPPPAQSKIGNFSDETLFFIFYSQPRDAMQEMAAHELYKHNWRYHKELRLWLTKEAGTEPTQKTASYERGSYIVFDPTLWERVRKEFVLEFSALESRRV